ncbi:TetR/AcrR family transcriptional regulator [Bradyrhizobium sp.]|uniref:TetR/AcrR family transcriptional regulator n=1 Tax=Bradyrhizobium sp. TaxID=376 RepID=UPI003C56501E
MAGQAQNAFEPRKSPVQARSTVTVQAIYEATIQVLLSQGAERLTTTRVAERAGVSVGTLYQYFPNKQSLLFAVLEAHIEKVAETMQTTCAHARGKPLAEMVKQVVEAFVDVKMQRADISAALYRIAADIDGPALIQRAALRMQKAFAAALRTAPDAVLRQEEFAIQMMFAAMAGVMRSVLEGGASKAMVEKLRHHLVLLCQSYLAATAQTRPRR